MNNHEEIVQVLKFIELYLKNEKDLDKDILEFTFGYVNF